MATEKSAAGARTYPLHNLAAPFPPRRSIVNHHRFRGGSGNGSSLGFWKPSKVTSAQRLAPLGPAGFNGWLSWNPNVASDQNWAAEHSTHH